MNFREYHSGYFLRKVTFNFNFKNVLTQHQPSKYILFFLITLSLVMWENEPMVIRCKFPVISYLFWVWGKYYQLNQKKKKKNHRQRKSQKYSTCARECTVEKGAKGSVWQQDTIVRSTPYISVSSCFCRI